jgi:hypothetical protein
VGARRGERRLPLREAAELLGVSKDALRQRIKRGTVRSDKGEDGRVYVYVDASTLASTHGVHNTATAEQAPDRTQELISTLREQLQVERQAHAEARRLLAAALERIPPQLEAPSEAQGTPTEGTDEQQGRGPIPDAGGPQEATERRWWEFWR